METNSYTEKGGVIQVRLGRKHIGDIKKNKESGKFFYKPKGSSKLVGEEFDTVAAVKRSLEAD